MVWLTWLWEQFQRIKVNCEVRIGSEIRESSGSFLSVKPVHVVVVVLRNIHSYQLKALQNVDYIELNLLSGEWI